MKRIKTLKKLLAVGVAAGAGVYAFKKFVAPKVSVFCLQDDDAADTEDNLDCDEDWSCDECACDECDYCASVRAVPLSEVPSDVKDAIGAVAAAVGFDVKKADDMDEFVLQPDGEYEAATYSFEDMAM